MAPNDDKPAMTVRRTTQASTDPQKTALVVLGMHRSGTSAMSRVLALSGAALPKRLMPAASANDLGHWEAQEIADLDDRILADLDSSWDDTFGPHRHGKARPSTSKYLEAATRIIRENWENQPVIVVKEPRMNLLLELWSQALTHEGYRPVYVIMTRHPVEVADSLKKRDGFTRNQSLILWAKYMLAAELGTRDFPRLFVRYDDLLTNPEDVLDRVESSLNVVLPRRSWLAATEIESFLTTDARHHNVAGKSVRKALPAIQNYYEYIESAAKGAPANEDASAALREWLASLEQAVGPILASIESRLRKTQSSLDAQKILVTDLNERLATSEAAFTERERQLIAEIDEWKIDVSTLRADFEQESARLREAVEAAHIERDAHRDAAATHANEAFQARTELDQARARHRGLDEARERQRRELDAALAEARQALEDRVREIEAERVAERAEFSRQLNEAQAESFKQLEAAQAEIVNQRDAAQAEIALLTASAAETRQNLQDELGQLQSRHDFFQSSMTALLDQVDNEHKDIISNYQARERALMDRASLANEENTSLLGTLNAKNTIISSLETELQEVRSRLDEDARVAALSTKRLLELESGISVMSDRYEHILSQNDSLSQQIESQRRLTEDLSKVLAETILHQDRISRVPVSRIVKELGLRLIGRFGFRSS